MKKTRTPRSRGQAPPPAPAMITVQMPLPMLAVMAGIGDDFQALCIDAGRQVLGAMMEHERTVRCGPKWKPRETREAQRAGSTRSLVVLGGRKIEVKRPRLRARDGREQELPSYRWAAAEDPLDQRTMEAIASGVATRKYPRVLDPLPPDEREVAVSRSAVSRRFVAESAAVVATYLQRPLGALDLRVIAIDGIVFRDHTILIALGVTANAEKVILGVHEGATENAGVVKALLRDLLERGLSTERALVFLIDGAKALRAAITSLFGPHALIHRCQVHKERNVLDHLPEALRPGTRRALRDAYAASDAALAQRQLERLASALERDHPGAAASLREGLAETLTLMRLGVTGALYRSLRSTNLIESLNGQVAHFTHNVRRWRDGAMIVRWVATAVRDAERKFRRLKGHKDMPRLVAALDAHQRSLQVDKRKKVA
jgi:Transposase and inactivated derivatives